MDPLSKTKIKYIKSLRLKKHRDREGLFAVEGIKAVREFIEAGWQPQLVVVTQAFAEAFSGSSFPVYLASPDMLTSLGNYSSNNSALALFSKREYGMAAIGYERPVLALYRLNDPGNLGTIIRIADWFDIEWVVLSRQSVDVYNPKAVAAAKGSLARVKVAVGDLHVWLQQVEVPVYMADLHGEPLNDFQPTSRGVIVLGSEAHGIDTELLPLATHRLTIAGQGQAESLNVAVAAGIICYQLTGQ